MGKKMMRRVVLLAVLALLAAGLLIAYCRRNSGDSIPLPPAETVRKVEITQGNVTVAIDDPNIIAVLIRAMSAAKDTGRESVSDSPAGNATRIRLVVSDSESITVFAYFDERGLQYKGALYLEIPYQGIYSIDAGFWDVVEQALRRI